MADVTCWGKPGCAGNARQMALLRRSGHRLQVRDLSAEPWTATRLRSFFGDTPVVDWFNRSAPRVTSGDIRPDRLSEAEALAVLIGEPLLIRRPLLECIETRTAGFDADLISGWIGLATGQAPAGEGCPRPDMQACHPTRTQAQENTSE